MITKSTTIISTAVGYDVIVRISSPLYGEITRYHRNITASSMNRFYALSNKWMRYTTTQEKPFGSLPRLFKDVSYKTLTRRHGG